MCCQVTVKPLDKLIAETILRVGQFDHASSEGDWEFERLLPNATKVLAKYETTQLRLTIRPGVHTYSDHIGMRDNAAIMFEIAWRYAEKVNGEIWQIANIAACRDEIRGEQALIAQAGLRPFRYEDICKGFREVFLAPLSTE